MLDSLGWASSIYARHYQYVFLASNVAAENVSVSYVNWINSLPASQKPKTYAVAIASDTVSSALAKGFEAFANAAGMKMVDNEVFSATATDLTDVFLKVKAANPDVVLVSSISNPSLILAVQTMHQLNLTPKAVFGLDSMGLPEIHTALGPLMENMMFDEVWQPTMTYQGSSDFSNLYKSTYGVYPETHSAIAYACGQILQQAIVGSNSLNSTAVRNYIVSHTFNTIYGPITFKQNGSPASPSDILAQWQNEKLQFVYPTNAANSTAVYPFRWGA
jgi:branched-chain amino acid transport system substrate-binding protein